MIAELFQTTVPNISMHIKNIYNEGELQPEATVKDFLTVQQEGNREVQRKLTYYNLDMIISGLSLIKPETMEYPEPEEILASVAAKEERILELVQEMRVLLEGRQKQ